MLGISITCVWSVKLSIKSIYSLSLSFVCCASGHTACLFFIFYFFTYFHSTLKMQIRRFRATGSELIYWVKAEEKVTESIIKSILPAWGKLNKPFVLEQKVNCYCRKTKAYLFRPTFNNEGIYNNCWKSAGRGAQTELCKYSGRRRSLECCQMTQQCSLFDLHFKHWMHMIDIKQSVNSRAESGEKTERQLA